MPGVLTRRSQGQAGTPGLHHEIIFPVEFILLENLVSHPYFDHLSKKNRRPSRGGGESIRCSRPRQAPSLRKFRPTGRVETAPLASCGVPKFVTRRLIIVQSLLLGLLILHNAPGSI